MLWLARAGGRAHVPRHMLPDLVPTLGVCAGASTLIIAKALASPAIDVEIELAAAKCD